MITSYFHFTLSRLSSFFCEFLFLLLSLLFFHFLHLLLLSASNSIAIYFNNSDLIYNICIMSSFLLFLKIIYTFIVCIFLQHLWVKIISVKYLFAYDNLYIYFSIFIFIKVSFTNTWRDSGSTSALNSKHNSSLNLWMYNVYNIHAPYAMNHYGKTWSWIMPQGKNITNGPMLYLNLADYTFTL